MSKTPNMNVTIRVDRELKKEADQLFSELGMSFTTAINVFLKQSVREGRIPFQISTGSVSDQEGITYFAKNIKE